MPNYTALAVASSESLVFSGPESLTPDGPSGGVRSTYLMHISNTADPLSSTAVAYLIPPGSEDTSSALLVRAGESAQYGPVRVDNLRDDIPDLYCSAAATVVITWSLVLSER